MKKNKLLMCLALALLCSCSKQTKPTNTVSSENLTTDSSSVNNNSSISSNNLEISTSQHNTSSSSSIPSENEGNNPPIDTNNPSLHTSTYFSGVCKENITTLGKTTRNIPQVSNEGLSAYPVYDKEFSNQALYDSIYNENNLLIASSSTYDSMDQQGNLFLNGNSTGRKLYKHTASINLYGKDVLDTEQAYIKKIEISPRKTGNYITGCYAPAGEVIKVKVSSETLKNNPNLKVEIGQCAQNGSTNDIPQGTTLTRMPRITNIMNIKNEETYVGSYFGGPIYIDGISSQNKKVDVTIEGAVNYAYLLYGNTSEEEYQTVSKSSAPYFDLEVYDKGVRHSGSLEYAKKYSYQDLLKAALLWKNIASVSNQFPGASNKDIGITFLYDTYVVYGVATAQLGLNYIQCYRDWLDGALNYDSFTKNGSWGHVHEYNHHFQDYIKLDGEATNNAVSLIEYLLFTNVSQNRTETSPSAGNWNLFADPYHSLLVTKQNQSKGELHDELNEYADILYSIGYEAYINAAKKCDRTDNYDQWFKAVCTEAKVDMTYYFTNIINKPISSEAISYVKSLNYAPFVPVASIYQTGIVRNGYPLVTNSTPFIVNSDHYTLDFNKYIAVPNGFTYTINDFIYKDSVSVIETSPNIYDITLLGDSSLDMFLNLTVTNGDITFDVQLDLELSKNYRELDYIRSPYERDTNTTTVIDARNTKMISHTSADGYYAMGTSGEEKINDGDDVDIFLATNWELNVQPYVITMDMNEIALVNKLTLCQGFTTAKNGPSQFKLYGGETEDDMSLIGEYKVQYENNYASITFDPVKIRFFKLEITANGNSYETYYGNISLSRLEMSLDLGNGYRLSPFDYNSLIDDNITKITKVDSTFGYLLSSQNGTVNYTCFGNKLVLFFDDYSNATVTVIDKKYEVNSNVLIIESDEGFKELTIQGTFTLDSLIVIK